MGGASLRPSRIRARTSGAVPITDHVVDEEAVSRFSLPAVRAAAPRFGPDRTLVPVVQRRRRRPLELQGRRGDRALARQRGAVAAAPAISPDGNRICFVVRHEERGHLYVMAADGTGSRRIAESLDARDAPSWSPDGKWIAVVASEGNEQPLFKVPVDGGEPVRLVGGINPTRSGRPMGSSSSIPSGAVDGLSRLKAVTPEGQPFAASGRSRHRHGR